MIDDKETLVEFRDIDVIRRHPAFRENLIRKSEAAILVYDITARESFDYIKSIYDQIISTKTSKKDLRAKPFTSCIVGNKSDCSSARKVEWVEGEKLAASLGCHFFETSGAIMENVEECLYDVVREVRVHKVSKYTSMGKSGGIFGGFRDVLCGKN